MTASGHWRPGRTSGKSGHVRYVADADWIRGACSPARSMGEHSAETKPQRPDLVCMWHEAKASDPDDSLRIGAQGTNEEDQAAAARQVQSLMQISDHVRWRDEIRRRFGETFGSCVSAGEETIGGG